jgi:hypothetical protein
VKASAIAIGYFVAWRALDPGYLSLDTGKGRKSFLSTEARRNAGAKFLWV